MSGSLSQAQFGDHAYAERYPIKTMYRVVGPDNRGIEAVLTHPLTEYPQPNPGLRGLVEKEGPNWKTVSGGPDGQMPLFDVEHYRPYVSWMQSNRDYRHYAGTLLGHIALDSRQRFGEHPVPDTSLSEHSSRMVSRLSRAGAVRQFREDRNAVDFAYTPIGQHGPSPYAHSVEDISPGQLRLGRRYLAAALRGHSDGPRPQDAPGERQLPMFMSAREIRDQFQGHDGDRQREAPPFGSGVELSKGRPETDDEMFDRKAEEATGRRTGSGDYLYDHIQRHGVLNPVALQADLRNVGSLGKPQILGGHHRVAVMHDVRPDELMPVEHYDSVKEARQAKGALY